MGGIELKYQTDNDSDDFVITPKFGVGLGAINLFYCYNISTNKYPFSSIGKHQISLVFNLNKKYFEKSDK